MIGRAEAERGNIQGTVFAILWTEYRILKKKKEKGKNEKENRLESELDSDRNGRGTSVREGTW